MLMKLIADSSLNIEIDVMLAASIQLKNCLKDSWKLPLDLDSITEEYYILTKEDKDFVMSNLLLLISNTKCLPIIRQLEEVFFIVADKEYPEGWIILLKQLNEGLRTAKGAWQFRAVLVSLKNMSKMYRYKDPNSRKIVIPFMDEIYANSLYELSIKLVEDKTDMAADLFKLVARSFYFYVSFDLSPAISNEVVFDKWMLLFQSAFEWSPITNPDTKHPTLKMKNAILEVFYAIFTYYGNPTSNIKESHRAFCLYVQKKYTVAIFNFAINVLKLSLVNYLSPKVIIMDLKILKEAIYNPYTTELIKALLLEILCQVAFRFLWLDDHLINYWKNNQAEYIQGVLEENEDGNDLRVSSIDFINTACKYKGYDQGVMKSRVNQVFLSEFMKFIERRLDESAKKSHIIEYEASLYALGSLSHIISKYIEQSEYAKTLLMTYALGGLDSTSWIIRACSCWVFSEFARMYFKETDKVLLACSKLLNCFRDECLSVKVIAAVAISKLAEKPYVEEQLRGQAVELISAVMWLMTQSETKELVRSLSSLITTFKDIIILHSYNIIQQLIEAYKRMSKHSIEKAAELGDFILTETETAASACLSTINQILNIIKDKQEMLVSIEPLIMSLMSIVLKPEELPFLENGIELLGCLSLYLNPITESLWKLIPELMDLTVGSLKDEIKSNIRKNGERGYGNINGVIVILQNVIVKEGDKFIKGKCQRGNYLNATLHFIERIFEIANLNKLEYDKIAGIKLLISMIEGLTVIP